ncbi:helix-turn-helix domain-containing protein [Streptomyces albogriseolus]|uniref:helix-turn-helix domain-containing protein n=1 Tax=Streptomyces albogriseolus TaxID=1887 RepID=UPI0036AFA8A1
MARPEVPVNHTVPDLGKLAEYLRSLRREAGLTYSELVTRTVCSEATLKRAASGRSLPDVGVAFQYAVSCVPHGQPIHDVGLTVVTLWRKAEKAVEKARRTAHRSSVLPKPQYARDDADLSGALRDAWARSGRPSTRAIERASGGQVPRSTANLIASAHAVPRDFRQYVAFLQVCEVNRQALEPWFRAWFKIRGVPNDPQAGFKALQGDGDAQAVYVDVYRQVTGSKASLAEVLERLIADHPSREAYYIDRDVAALTELVAPSAGSPRSDGRDWMDAFPRKRWRARKTRDSYDPPVLTPQGLTSAFFDYEQPRPDISIQRTSRTRRLAGAAVSEGKLQFCDVHRATEYLYGRSRDVPKVVR